MSRSKNKKSDLTIPLTQGKRRREVVVPGKLLGWEWKEQGQQLLILPSAQARWSATTPLWRSVLLRKNEVVSTGLPKFWDPEFSPQNVELLEDDVVCGDKPTASIKYDGQLLIRYVSGSVHFRTRTSFNVDPSLLQPLQEMLKLYPTLNDPNWHPELSLQFEFCLKRNRIIVSYDKDLLILIGASENKSLSPLPWEDIQDIANEAGLTVSPTISLKGSNLKEWLDEVEELDAQGVLLKSNRYKRAFRMRYDYPPGALYKALERENKRTKNKTSDEVLQAALASLKVVSEDKEAITAALLLIVKKEEDCKKRPQELEEVVKTSKQITTRGVFARETASQYEIPEGPCLLKLWDNDAQAALQALTSHALNRLYEDLDKNTIIDFK
jgi:hypothetical protein